MISLQELHNITVKELMSKLVKARHELVKMRIQIKTKQSKNTHVMNDMKKYIARLLTILKQKTEREAVTPKPKHHEN